RDHWAPPAVTLANRDVRVANLQRSLRHRRASSCIVRPADHTCAPVRFRGRQRHAEAHAVRPSTRFVSSALSAAAMVLRGTKELPRELLAPAAAGLMNGLPPETAELVLGLAREAANL